MQQAIGTVDFRGTPFVGPRELIKASVAQLQGALCGVPPFEGEHHVRRVVSVGAGVGAWAAYAAHRFPYAWADLFEPDEELARYCRLNAPPGARVFHDPELVEIEKRAGDGCDVLHMSIPTGLHRFDLRRVRAVTCQWEAEELAILQGEELVKARFRLVAGGVLDVGEQWQTWVRA